MTYDECVVNAAIAIFSGRQIPGPEQAIGLAVTIADALKAADYLEKDPEPSKPKKIKHQKPVKNGPSSTPGNDRVGAGSSKD